MAPSGNKDTKGTTKEVISSKPVETQPVAVETAGSKSALQEWISSTKNTINSWKSSSCQWYSSSNEINQVKRFRKQFSTNYCHPLGDTYREFPLALTNWKFNQISKYNQKERLFALQGLSLLVAVATLRVKGDLGLTKRVLFSFRNSTVAFLFGGLIIAPEIYNPLIKSDF